MFHKKISAALDLGDHSVKYVEVEADTATVRRTWLREILPDRVSAKETMSEEKTAQRVGSLVAALQAEGPVSSNVVTAMQGDGTWIQYLEFPHLPAGELKVAAQAAACKTLPFSLDQVVLSTIPVPALKGANRSGALVVAALRKPAEHLSHMLAGFGLYVHRLDVVPLALVREFARNHPECAGESVALVSVGFTFTHVVAARGGMPYFVREFAIGGRRFTYGVQMAHRFQWKEAEELRLGSDVTDRDAAYEPFVREWLEEVRQSVAHFNERIAGPDKQVTRVLLSGGCAAWKGLRERLAEHLGLPVATDAWARIQCTSKTAKAHGAEVWKAAIGMALEP